MKFSQSKDNPFKRWISLPVITLATAFTVGHFALLLSPQSAIANPNGTSIEQQRKFDHSHIRWNAMLKKYVRRGDVDYAGIKKNGREALLEYLKSLESVGKSEYKGWNRKQKIAFGVNAYNAYTVLLVLDHYPIKSLRKTGALPGAAWKKNFIPLDRIWGKKLSLSQLENDILRPHFEEPRIHFALVCAAKSCPPLRNEAYRAAGLNKQLDAQARRFLGNNDKNRYDPSKKTLYLSKIFQWYEADFTKSSPTVAAYAAGFMPKEVMAATKAGGMEVEYLPYDWNLNEK
jgi:hypothetical protein